MENQDTSTNKDGLSPSLSVAASSAFERLGREIFAEVTERVATEGMGEDDERIMEIAEKHGLAKRVPYDPVIHDNVDAEEGSIIWFWGKQNTKVTHGPSAGRWL